jgi:hypothetical protein
MRKLFHIFLILSLLMSTAGYAVTKHFCGEVLAHISVGHESASCCDSSEMPSDCECENETDHLVLEDDYQLDHQEVRFTPELQATIISFFKLLAFASSVDEQAKNLLPTLKYPPFTDLNIHIKVQSFLL